ncbi:MAG: hypothetical protein ACRECF_04495 [Methyloceanibacter sp.]
MTTWAVDLANVGAVYPWIGYEVIMVLVAVALWILWHVLQLRQENEELTEDIRLYGDKESIRKALDEHPH